jgi:hypothetical protein
MSDETTVDAGSETSDDQAVDTTATAETTTTDTSATETAQADEGASADAGVAADTTTTDDASVPVDGSRTGFVDKGQPGGECICPDGRKGTIHSFDAGLVCIPNEDQSA